MRDSLPSGRAGDPEPVADRNKAAPESREVIIPHDAAAGPVTTVRNVVVQFSIAQLKEHGLYERYAQAISPRVLEELLSHLAPGWIPVELVLAHYDACEKLGLSTEELTKLGARTGDRLQETSLVSVAKKVRSPDFDLWSAVGALYRMWARLYQGGSVQIVRLAPKIKVLEQRGFPMNRYAYFRQAQLGAVSSSYTALGARVSSLQLTSYDADKGEAVMRLTWL
jgi:hypothetical protein